MSNLLIRSPGSLDGKSKVARYTLKAKRGILHCTFIGEGSLTRYRLVGRPGGTWLELMKLCWRRGGGRIFKSLLKSRKTDLVLHSRFFI